jgi:hypothetical protein
VGSRIRLPLTRGVQLTAQLGRSYWLAGVPTCGGDCTPAAALRV